MMKNKFFQLLLAVLLCLPANPSFSQNIRPNLYAGYVGEWVGTYYVYTPEGKLVKKIEARHVYKGIDEYTIEGTQTIQHSDGIVENVKSRNFIDNGRLYCRVDSDRSGTKILEGHLEGNQIFWSRRDKGVIESYRERLVNNRKLYVIDGYGIYGTDRSRVYTFFGEYKRVK